jgi:hypothetical protein
MGTRRQLIQRPVRPRITVAAARDYATYCQSDGAEGDAAFWKIYWACHLRPWFEELPRIFPDNQEDDQQWAACLGQALQRVYLTDKARFVARNEADPPGRRTKGEVDERPKGLA